MPPLHRYLGTPVTTWILNVIFSSHFSDIHCGMRGITRDALERMGLRSQSWEYASEMVLKSRPHEAPDGGGADPLPQGPRGAPQPSQALGVVFAVGGGVDQPARDVRLRGRLLPLPAGLRAHCSGHGAHPAALVRAAHDRAHHLLALLDAPRAHAGDARACSASTWGSWRRSSSTTRARSTKRWFARFPYTRTVAIAAATFLAGLVLTGGLVIHWVSHQFLLSAETPWSPPGRDRVAPHRRGLHDVHVHVAPPLDGRGRVAAPVSGKGLTRGDDRTPDN